MNVNILNQLSQSDLRGKRIGNAIDIKESKTGKVNVFMVNKAVYKSLIYLLNSKCEHEHYLFKSRVGQNKPLTVQTVNRMLKTWTRAINLSGIWVIGNPYSIFFFLWAVVTGYQSSS